jgi:hypothetical protein
MSNDLAITFPYDAVIAAPGAGLFAQKSVKTRDASVERAGKWCMAQHRSDRHPPP